MKKEKLLLQSRSFIRQDSVVGEKLIRPEGEESYGKENYLKIVRRRNFALYTRAMEKAALLFQGGE